jgi:hypothetical protein
MVIDKGLEKLMNILQYGGESAEVLYFFCGRCSNAI